MVIGIYPRKSVYRDNSDSVDVQVNMCKEYAGIILRDQTLEFKVYGRDEGFSGKNTNRTSFQELMQDVQEDVLYLLHHLNNLFLVFHKNTPSGRTILHYIKILPRRKV